MPIPFIQGDPTPQQVEMIRLAMSTFCDGSGQLREEGGGSRPGWRDYERIFAELLNGYSSENKEIFDVIVPSGENEKVSYGISLKSKELGNARTLNDLNTSGRVYMELSNSPAKFWFALQAKGFSEADFRNMKHADMIGNTVIATVKEWHKDAARTYAHTHPGKTLDLEASIYLTISYSSLTAKTPRVYALHSFSLDFPNEIKWKYNTNKCLRGYDSQNTNGVVIDWYALSGGQLKYYPRASDAKYHTTPFVLLSPKKITITEKARVYWPKEWASAEAK